MNIDVIVATRGRSENVRVLLDRLRLQVRAPDNIVIVGTESGDLPDIGSLQDGTRAHALISPKAGLTSQRNFGAQAVRERSSSTAWRTKIIVFFDDDFRPANDWLQNCEVLFAANPQVVAVTGTVLMDGARGSIAVTEDQASRALAAHSSGDRTGPVTCKEGLYGCNMAVRATVMDRCAFDENLPLYGWLEDTDFSGQIRKFANIHRASNLIGVHLGSKSGRINGFRYGYSQISNPLYLLKKGTISPGKCGYFCMRAIASNSLRSVREHAMIDYRGRFAGNLAAMSDLLGGSIHPTKILFSCK